MGLQGRQYVLRIQKSLNLKLKDFVFIDDCADQRLLVKDAIPEICILDATSPAPGNSSLSGRTHCLITLKLIVPNNTVNVTNVRASSPRPSRRTQQRHLPNCYIRIDIRESKSAELKCALELINRTNQFNLAGSRTSLKEINEWHRIRPDEL